jgi:hypothetical protein
VDPGRVGAEFGEGRGVLGCQPSHLLSSGNAGEGRLATPYEKAVGFYGDARRAIGHDLRTLAVAAQGDRTDEHTVESLTDFAEYQELIGRALENDARTGGKPAALADYRKATDLLQNHLLPGARKLVDSNNSAFNTRYAQARSTLATQLVVAVVLGVLLLVSLGVLQWYLARRFHRILNPGVLSAMVCGPRRRRRSRRTPSTSATTARSAPCLRRARNARPSRSAWAGRRVRRMPTSGRG